MKTKLLFIVALLLITATTFSQNKTEWRGGSNGIYSDTGLLNSWPESGPEMAWVFEGLGEGHSSPVLALDHIFVSTMIEKDGFIFILDKAGKEVKRYKYGEEFFESFPGARSTPVVVDNMLYIYSGMGVIYAFDAMEGTLQWKKDVLSDTDGENIRWGVTETLVIDGDMIFSSPGGKVNNIIALNRHNGNTIWTSPGVGDLSAYCTPVLIEMEGRKLLVTMMASHILGIDAADGTLLWNYEQPNKWSVHANTPIYDNGLLVCTSGYGHGTVCLKLNADGSSAEKVWFNENLDSRMGGVVLIDGYLYASGDQKREWRCYDVKTGAEKWKTSEIGKGVVIAADQKLFLYSERGELAMAEVSPDKFTLLSKSKVEKGSAQHWSHPVIDNGMLYLRHGNAIMAYIIK